MHSLSSKVAYLKHSDLRKQTDMFMQQKCKQIRNTSDFCSVYCHCNTYIVIFIRYSSSVLKQEREYRTDYIYRLCI